MSEEEFAKCKYDINKLPHKKRCIEVYPDLKPFKEIFDKKDLPADLDSEFVMKFLILVYTPSSPFVKTYVDLPTRKTKALNYLGVDTNFELSPSLKDMASLRHAGVSARWLTFVRIQSNEDWTFLVTCQERYVRQIEEFTNKTELNPQDEVKITQNLKSLREQIKETTESLMAGEKSKVQEELISFSVMAESLSIMPEHYVAIWAQMNKLPYDLSRTGL